jgi:predicted nucleotidyltransferase
MTEKEILPKEANHKPRQAEGGSERRLSENDLQTARELKKRISKFTPLIDFRLFGSRGRGDAKAFSDMDIFMEFETVDRELRNRVKNAAWEMTLETGKGFFSNDKSRMQGEIVLRCLTMGTNPMSPSEHPVDNRTDHGKNGGKRRWPRQ